MNPPRKKEEDATPQLTEAATGGPAPPAAEEPMLTDLPPPSRAKAERLAATALVKEESKVLESLIRKLEKCGAALEHVVAREEKPLQVLERPRPPRLPVPVEKQCLV